MDILQIFVLIFVFFVVSRTILRLKDNEISVSEFIFWILIWALVLVVIFIPKITIKISGMLGIGRGIDLVIYFSILLLFYLVFRIYVKIEKVEQEITTIVREVSLKKIKKR
ncbi:hypothetical protein COV93_01810 [Candidatus Woesearchaeota archaeon CG11_big_fil_rev_8_21_14_0_20_43_8]|nr:MAG: hypothetical protein COV93_01810 [Candidatus Woesearchaeota archaeon CG11_big_fil_rev_8_21_14_0_20_43_8]PIO05555.1 MAG: DUF2304 domain-containing protein [Candidatus Woesearchaeota archaeon CG08_land_8_20_14_0_20_43_7]